MARSVATAGRPPLGAQVALISVTLDLPPRFHDMALKAARALASEPLETYLLRCAARGMAGDLRAWVDRLLSLEGQADDALFARLEGQLLELAGVGQAPGDTA